MASQEIIVGVEAAALECSLCMERFTNPKILTCVHSFCLGCLEKWVEKSNGRLSCPTCRKVCEIPTGGLSNLKNNIFITGLLDYVTTLDQKSALTCTVCKKTVCSFFCQDCDELYCVTCKTAHTKMKMAKHHSIITLQEYTAINPMERFASQSVYCPDHNMPLQFFCDTCEIPICIGCTLLQHPKGNTHKIIDVESAFEAFTTLSSQFIKQTDEKLLGFHGMVRKLKKDETMVKSNYTKCTTVIRKEADYLHELIDRLKNQQLQNLESSHKQHLKILESDTSDVELAISKLSSMRGIAHNLSSSPNHVMALMSSSGISGRMDELLNEVITIGDKSDTFGYTSYGGLYKLLMEKFNIKLQQSKLTVVYQHPPSMRAFFRYSKTHPDELYITTLTESLKPAYEKEAKVKCLRINQNDYNNLQVDGINNKIKCELLDITDEYTGRYKINCEVPLKNCTLICLIINGPAVVFKWIDFDSSGNCNPPEFESNFILF